MCYDAQLHIAARKPAVEDYACNLGLDAEASQQLGSWMPTASTRATRTSNYRPSRRRQRYPQKALSGYVQLRVFEDGTRYTTDRS
jgi:hypothetical protein